MYIWWYCFSTLLKSFEQCWRKKIKEEALRIKESTYLHATGMYRVIGPLINFTLVYNAFNIKDCNKLFVPETDRIKIW
jgi:putative endopeptidase